MPIPTQLPVIDAVSVVKVLFLLALLIVIPTTLAFYYHWGRFAPTRIGAIATIVVYTIGLAVLLMGLLGIVLSM